MQRIREDAVLKAHEKAKEETDAKAVQKRERSRCALEATVKVNPELPDSWLRYRSGQCPLGSRAVGSGASKGLLPFRLDCCCL